jgi:hypothetical protein
MSYPGTRAIIDGTTATPGVSQVRLPLNLSVSNLQVTLLTDLSPHHQGILHLNICCHVILDNILIRNSKEDGTRTSSPHLHLIVGLIALWLCRLCVHPQVCRCITTMILLSRTVKFMTFRKGIILRPQQTQNM